MRTSDRRFLNTCIAWICLFISADKLVLCRARWTAVAGAWFAFLLARLTWRERQRNYVCAECHGFQRRSANARDRAGVRHFGTCTRAKATWLTCVRAPSRTNLARNTQQSPAALLWRKARRTATSLMRHSPQLRGVYAQHYQVEDQGLSPFCGRSAAII